MHNLEGHYLGENRREEGSLSRESHCLVGEILLRIIEGKGIDA